MKLIKTTGLAIIVIWLVYFAGMALLNRAIENTDFSQAYSQCKKIWSARGYVGEGEQQNSIESISRAMNLGAQGVEIDMFYDVNMDRFIVSHNYPYRKKNGKLLTFEKVLESVPSLGFVWMDFKKLRLLDSTQVTAAVKRLEMLVDAFNNRGKIYIEGSDPINLRYFVKAGFNTIFDIQPLPSSYFVSKFMLNMYKLVYLFGGYTVIALQYEEEGIYKYDEVMAQRLGKIPVFTYHVLNTDEDIDRLLKAETVKVFLVGRGISVNHYNRTVCSDGSG